MKNNIINNSKSAKISTFNLQEAIATFANQKLIDKKFVDFELLSYKTYISSCGKKYKVLDEEVTRKLKSLKKFLDKDLNVKQSYEVIFKIENIKNREFFSTLSSNKNLTTLFFTIKSGSLLPKENLDNFIQNEIYKSVLKNGFLIKIFDVAYGDIFKNINVLLDEQNRLIKDLKFIVSDAIEPVASLSKNKINKLYENSSNSKNIDSKKYFIAKQNDVLIEIVKTKQINYGRNCKAQILQGQNLQTDPITFDCGLGVSRSEFKNKILYIANKNGLVFFDEKIVDIIDEDFAKYYKHQDLKNFSILKGDFLSNKETKYINVVFEGNIVAGSKIVSNNIVVQDKVFKNASIVSYNKADIYTHCGNLKCNEATIANLDGGYIEAKKVVIKNMLSGSVKADNIYIDSVGNDCQLDANESIVINYINGVNNKFIIKLSEKSPEKIKPLNDEIKQRVEDLYYEKKKILSTMYIDENDIKKIEEIDFEIKTLTSFANIESNIDFDKKIIRVKKSFSTQCSFGFIYNGEVYKKNFSTNEHNNIFKFVKYDNFSYNIDIFRG